MDNTNLFKNMSINEMKTALAERQMNSLDFSWTHSILMNGWKGYNNMSDEDIEEQYITHFGDTIKRDMEFAFD